MCCARGARSLLKGLGISRYSVCLERADGAPGWFVWEDDDPRELPGFREVAPRGRAVLVIQPRQIKS